MSKYRRLLSFVLLALVVFSSSVFLFTSKVYADTPLPLKENERIIEEKTAIVEEKRNILEDTTQEIENLVEKKQTLAQQLEAIKQETADLQKKLADKKAAAEAEKKRLAEVKNMFVHISKYAGDSRGNLYTAGYCTWYVKNRRADIPNNLGNANTWYARAAAQGWNVGLTPKKGAVATSTSGPDGHVAYVEGVSLDGQWATISEMNYRGLYSMNTRVVHYTEFRYIYELN